MPKLSVLDLAPIVEGGNAGEALRQSAELAEALPFVGSQTSTIRIGAGGIMLPNHAPLIVAEQFGTLESLFPGRVDLGLGRAPGTDRAAAFALRRNLASDENQFPNDVVELIGYFERQ